MDDQREHGEAWWEPDDEILEQEEHEKDEKIESLRHHGNVFRCDPDESAGLADKTPDAA